jgi:molybdopterin converting factor small subunit
MSWLARVGGLLRREAKGTIRVRVVLKGRIGEGWFDVDQRIPLPPGATLATLIERADQRGLQLSRAIEHSPHLRHTLMWNGQRAPVDENLARPLADGDQVYLLGPLAGG